MKQTLKERLAQSPFILAPGIYDALSGILAERSGAPCLYLSGASIAYTRFGQPDLGLVDMGEVAQILEAVCERVSVPVIVDADNGFGNALNVQRTVRKFERAGAGAIQLEDQTLPKRCGHLSGKTLVSTGEMVGKIKAACDARASDDTLVIARTDAVAVEGFDSGIARALAYAEAGADILFIEALRTVDEMRRAGEMAGAVKPLLANMVEGGRTPILAAPELQALGFKIAIYPGGAVRAIARTLEAFYGTLAEAGTTLPFRDRMLDFDGINRVVGTEELLALGQRYADQD